MFKINNTEMPEPATMSVQIIDIDGETNRTASGLMIRDRICIKRKIECSWNALTPLQMQTLLNAMSDTFFSIYYYDPMTGYTTKTFYVGDRTAPCYRLVSGKELWSGLSANFIEQ